MNTKLIIISLAVLASALIACESNKSPALVGDGGTTDTDTDADTDTDSDSDTDSDADTDSDTDSECGDPIMHAVVRDFPSSHPDFETYGNTVATPGIVEEDLGTDGKPVYAHTGPFGTPQQTTGPTEFAQWYNTETGVNEEFAVDLTLIEQDGGVWTYDNSAFFPVGPSEGFGDEGNGDNFHFTTEIHIEFVYKGGEIFTFTGDDDLWLFVNEKLVIDLGGLHPALTDTIALDDVATQAGLIAGETYPMDIFHAERHTSASNFRIDTSIDCVDPVIE
jgi:fibro-slime domain-containing protein